MRFILLGRSVATARKNHSITAPPAGSGQQAGAAMPPKIDTPPRLVG
jgi:hypothetical protein